MKNVVVQFSVSYDTIRKMFCMVTGKVISDEQIDEVIDGNVVNVDTNTLGDAKDQTEQMLGALILAEKFGSYHVPKKSKFEERLEFMKKQKGL